MQLWEERLMELYEEIVWLKDKEWAREWMRQDDSRNYIKYAGRFPLCPVEEEVITHNEEYLSRVNYSDDVELFLSEPDCGAVYTYYIESISTLEKMNTIFKHRAIHNEEGPAVFYVGGKVQYFLHNYEVSKEYVDALNKEKNKEKEEEEKLFGVVRGYYPNIKLEEER